MPILLSPPRIISPLLIESFGWAIKRIMWWRKGLNNPGQAPVLVEVENYDLYVGLVVPETFVTPRISSTTKIYRILILFLSLDQYWLSISFCYV